MESGWFLAQSVVPSSGSTAMSTSGPSPAPTSSPMKSIGASSRSPSPMTMRPCDVDLAHLAAHGFDGGAVGRLLVALAAPGGRGERRRLGDAHQFEREGTVDRRLGVGVGLAELHGTPCPAARGAKLQLFDPDHLRIADNEPIALDRLQARPGQSAPWWSA